jgi:hypothetical protein
LQAMREFLEETTRNQEEEDDEVAVQLKTSRPSTSPDNRASYLGYSVQGVVQGPYIYIDPRRVPPFSPTWLEAG